MRSLRITLFLLLAATAFSARAANLDFNLGSNAAAIDYTVGLSDGGLEGDLYFLHHTDQVDIGAAGLDVIGNASPVGSPVLFGIGGKVFAVNPKGGLGDGTAAAIGFHFKYTWPTYNRFMVGGGLYYAPNIVSFQNVDRFMFVEVKAGYEVLRNADIYAGYRHVSAAFDGGPNATLDNTFMLGMNLTF